MIALHICVKYLIEFSQHELKIGDIDTIYIMRNLSLGKKFTCRHKASRAGE